MDNNHYEYRSVITIAKKIITKIPIENEEFIMEINTFLKGLWNKAPELLVNSVCWIPFTYILQKHLENFENIEDGWQKEVLDIYMGNV